MKLAEIIAIEAVRYMWLEDDYPAEIVGDLDQAPPRKRERPRLRRV